MTINHAWRALRHRNFRLFFFGQGISVIGTWMTRIATSWLVYRLTHSALLLGLVTFAGNFIAFVLQPVAGVWVERLNKQKLLVWTQILACLQSFALAALTLANVITLPEIIALQTFQGIINAFDTPGRQTFLIQMVDGPEDLSNAIAINSSIVNGARLIGPAIGGIVISAVGEGWCFFIDGVSYFAVIASLLMMNITHLHRLARESGVLEQMGEGWRYVRQHRPIRSILILFSLTALMGYPYTVLMPLFAGSILKGGPHTLGWLMGASGVGALTSALSLTLRRTVRGLGRMIQVSSMMLGFALIVFGWSKSLTLSLLILPFVGFGLMQTAAASNTVIQHLVSEDKRARVMSYYTMAFYGAAPLGSLLAGFVAEAIGAPHTIMITGLFCILGSLWFFFELPKVRAVVSVPSQN